jgi:hypothetical protein
MPFIYEFLTNGTYSRKNIIKTNFGDINYNDIDPLEKEKETYMIELTFNDDDGFFLILHSYNESYSGDIPKLNKGIQQIYPNINLYGNFWLVRTEMNTDNFIDVEDDDIDVFKFYDFSNITYSAPRLLKPEEYNKLKNEMKSFVARYNHYNDYE